MSSLRRPTVAAAFWISIAAVAPSAFGDAPAFPGAQGFGAVATGGRNGSIYVVTNLNDSGPGSFRYGVTNTSNVIVVFAVSGYIDLQSAVSIGSNITILGQTAPGEGIGFMGRELSFSGKTNDIVQYIRAREGSIDTSNGSEGKPSINLGTSSNMILDHVSAEFSQYDNIDAVGVTNVTVQNSIIADGIHGQYFNMHTEGTDVTYLNNVWANSGGRSPLSKANDQYVNNVVYDYGYGYTTADTGGKFTHDILNNYFIAGPSTGNKDDAFYQMTANDSIYASGNLLDGNKDGTLNGNPFAPDDGTKVSVTNLSSEGLPTTKYLPVLSTTDAYTFDNAHAGDMYSNGDGTFGRDEVDAQVISQVQSAGTAGAKMNTEVHTGLDNGGFGTIPATTVDSSTTLDTVPFTWLQAYGLSTTNANDLLKKNALGYTMIEQYASEIADQYASQTWTNASGSWVSGTWNSATPGPYDHAYILGNGTTNGSATIAGSDAASAFSLNIGGNGPAAGESLNVTGGSLNVQATITVGDKNNAALNISGGSVFTYNVQLGNTVLDANGNPTATYTGTLNLTGGTLTVQQLVLGGGTYGAWNTGGIFNWNGGTLQAFNTLTVNVPATLGSNGGIIDSNGYSGTLSGILSGAGGLVKIGAGAITLSAHNTYTGRTTIAAGQLIVTGSLANNSSAAISISPDGVASITRATVANASYDNWGSSASTDLQSHADIRAGKNSSNNPSGEFIAMSWRTRTAAEIAGTGGPQLASDVITITGMANSGTTGSGQTDPFALQLSYVPTPTGTPMLDWNRGGSWVNAVLGNFGVGSNVFTNVQSSWDAFAAANRITDSNIGNFLGSWGVDPTTDTVWAVLNHNSDFSVGITAAAPVPEPASLSLLAFGGVALVRRRRRS